MLPFLFIIFLMGIDLLSASNTIQPNITNTTGHYYFIIVSGSLNAASSSGSESDAPDSLINTIKTPLINCTSDIFCYIKCDGDSSCETFYITSSITPKIEINCIGFHSCYKSILKLNNINTITLNCQNTNACSNSIINGENASYFNAICNGCENSQFYLSTTKQITMKCVSCQSTDIFATNALSLNIVCNGKYQCSDVKLYCPYTDNNICKIICSSSDGSCGSNFQIIIPYIQTNTTFISLTNYSYSSPNIQSAIYIYCNNNKAQYSSTYIVYDLITQHIECSNIT
eukprot:515938_1